MRRPRLYSLIGTFLVLMLLLAIVAAGCGTAETAGQAQPALTTAQGILEQALAGKNQVTAGTGDFDLSVTVTGEQAKMPAAAQGLMGQPLTVSGTYSFDKAAKAGQISLNAGAAGQALTVGLEAIDGQSWLQLMGQWYQIPAEKAGATTTTAQKVQAAAIQQALTAAGVDPKTWLTDLKVVSEETLNETPVSHLSAAVNVSQIASDISKLVTSGALKNLLPGKTSNTEPTTTGDSLSIKMPTQEELQKLQAQLTAAVQSLTIDAWITKDTYQFRKLEVKATIVPPAESAASESTTPPSTATSESNSQAAAEQMLAGLGQAIKSISIDASISLAPATGPVKITPPVDVKPWSQLQTLVKGFTGMFSGALEKGSTSTTGQ
jgi:hypothetical protein